ncbi:two-component-system connector protein YcgZ [Escherichia coli]|uniref:Two-component-system connector protein YcgZ n=9 Tax=Enterobacterales TaxID=91347 RepID=A0A8S0FX35_ECOLX|nr:two-component-system connector protein YcgZ [Escherichia coli]
MHQNSVTSDSFHFLSVKKRLKCAGAITRYFAKANLPTQQETLGEIVTEILKDGRNLSRKSLCAKLLCRLEQATGEEEQKHYNALIGLLFE